MSTGLYEIPSHTWSLGKLGKKMKFVLPYSLPNHNNDRKEELPPGVSEKERYRMNELKQMRHKNKSEKTDMEIR